jgi:AcrR family transcriptional regulator
VYNYFGSKEELYFDQAEIEDEFNRAVRRRYPGESIADALKRDFLEALDRAPEGIGLTTGMSAAWSVVDASPRLQARLAELGHRAVDRLADELAAEEVCASDTGLTLTVASLPAAVGWSLQAELRRRIRNNESLDGIKAAMRPLADQAFGLLSDGIGGLGKRHPRPPNVV